MTRLFKYWGIGFVLFSVLAMFFGCMNGHMAAVEYNNVAGVSSYHMNPAQTAGEYGVYGAFGGAIFYLFLSVLGAAAALIVRAYRFVWRKLA